jgi:DsbC/DsbD-like thiol-disulfide interchange protein
VLSTFAKAYGIEYSLLADVGSHVIRDFGILNTMIEPAAEEYYGIPIPGSYLVGTDGRVAGRFFHREYQVRETAATVLHAGFDVAVDPASMAHDEVETEGVSVRAELAATELHTHQRAYVYVHLNLADGLHVYGEPIPEGYVPTRVSATATDGLVIGEPEYPATTPFSIEGLTEQFHVFGGDVKIALPVTSEIREAGTAAIDVEVSYQACTGQMCYLPRTDKLHIKLATAPSVREAGPSVR